MPAAPTLRLEGVTVRFGDTVALDGVDLDLPAGVRAAVVGENGAGKSTLLHLLAGRLRPAAGTILLDGTPTVFRSPRDAALHGIGLIPQHDDLIPAWSVLENILLGAEGARGLLPLDRSGARRRIEALAEAAGLSVESDAPVESLSVPARQRAAILRALFRGARVLLLDEPTAVLSPSEADDLWRTTQRLCEQGVTVAFVTHRLEEVQRHAETVAVLRRGVRAFVGDARETDRATLIRAMVGETTPEIGRTPLEPGEVVLRVRQPAFEARVGEVVGIAGVEGSGQSALVDALVGLAASPGLTLGDEAAEGWSVARRRAWGLGFIPEDRHRDALAVGLSVADNAALGWHRSPAWSRVGLLSSRAVHRHAVALCAAGDVRGASPGVRAGALSGGNQQKLVLEREFARPLRALVAYHPTRGLDLGASTRVHQRLREQARTAAVLVVSSDLDELRAVSDRIVVFYDGRIVGDTPVSEASDARLGAWMTGSA